MVKKNTITSVILLCAIVLICIGIFFRFNYSKKKIEETKLLLHNAIERDFVYEHSPIGYILKQKTDIKIIKINDNQVFLSMNTTDVSDALIHKVLELDELNEDKLLDVMQEVFDDVVYKNKTYAFTFEIINGEAYIAYGNDFLSHSLCGMDIAQQEINQMVIEEMLEDYND